MISSVQRADRILDLFSSDVPSWSLTEMAAELELSKSIVWEYAKTLDDLGILRRDGNGRYRLGWRTFQLGLRARMASEISQPARKEIHALASELQETVQLSTRHRDQVVFLEKFVPESGIRLNATRVGERLPAHTTASGKILLSSLSVEEIEALFREEELVQSTPKSITSRGKLLEELSSVVKDGFALDESETFQDLNCLGVPVTNRDGDIAWALSVTFYNYKQGSHGELYRRLIMGAAFRLSLLTRDFSE